MTEQNPAPEGSAYGLAVSLLQQCQAHPSCVVIHPDHVLWQCSSGDLAGPHITLKVLEAAAAVLSAFKARQLPVALVVPATAAARVRECLQDSLLLQDFAALVEVDEGAGGAQQQQQQTEPSAASSSSSSNAGWTAAANRLKADLGTPWQQLLFFSADVAAVRHASRLGMAAVRVPASTGLTVKDLQAGLQSYAAKLDSDRGY